MQNLFCQTHEIKIKDHDIVGITPVAFGSRETRIPARSVTGVRINRTSNDLYFLLFGLFVIASFPALIVALWLFILLLVMGFGFLGLWWTSKKIVLTISSPTEKIPFKSSLSDRQELEDFVEKVHHLVEQSANV